MAVVQLARTSDCDSEGCGFDSRQSPHAEWCNGSMTDSDSVGIGSNPIFVGFFAIWCNGSTQDFDSCGMGSNPVIVVMIK